MTLLYLLGNNHRIVVLPVYIDHVHHIGQIQEFRHLGAYLGSGPINGQITTKHQVKFPDPQTSSRKDTCRGKCVGTSKDRV